MNNIARTYDFSPKDRTFLVMPLFQVHGLVCALLTPLLTGGTTVIPTRFSATSFWNDFTVTSCNWYTAVPTIHQILLRTPTPNPLPRLRFIRSCSAPLAPATLYALETKFSTPVLEAYAMTEAAHQMTSNPLTSKGPHKPGSVGLGQGVEVAILNDQGKRVEKGEVVIRGKNVTKGYLNNPEANQKDWIEGWFRTGDQGYLDADGYLFLTGRLKELINRGGEKFSPLEVDNVLAGSGFLAEGIAFAVPDEKYGQEVHAVVVLKEGVERAGAEEKVKEFVGTKVAAFKVPKVVYIVDAVPKTATGKIQRGNLAKILFEEGGTKAKL